MPVCSRSESETWVRDHRTNIYNTFATEAARARCTWFLGQVGNFASTEKSFQQGPESPEKACGPDLQMKAGPMEPWLGN